MISNLYFPKLHNIKHSAIEQNNLGAIFSTKNSENGVIILDIHKLSKNVLSVIHISKTSAGDRKLFFFWRIAQKTQKTCFIKWNILVWTKKII